VYVFAQYFFLDCGMTYPLTDYHKIAHKFGVGSSLKSKFLKFGGETQIGLLNFAQL